MDSQQGVFLSWNGMAVGGRGMAYLWKPDLPHIASDNPECLRGRSNYEGMTIRENFPVTKPPAKLGDLPIIHFQRIAADYVGDIWHSHLSGEPGYDSIRRGKIRITLLGEERPAARHRTPWHHHVHLPAFHSLHYLLITQRQSVNPQNIQKSRLPLRRLLPPSTNTKLQPQP
jgi:hypothetical protein